MRNRILRGKVFAILASPVLLAFCISPQSAHAEESSHPTFPAVIWETPLNSVGVASQSDILHDNPPVQYAVAGQSLKMEEAEGPDGGGTAYNVQNAYYRLDCVEVHSSTQTAMLPDYTVPPDPQIGTLNTDLNPTYWDTDVVKVPTTCGTPSGLYAGGPVGNVYYCETTPGYYGSKNWCGGSTPVNIVLNASDLPPSPGPPGGSGTITLYTILPSSDQITNGRFPISTNQGQYFYNTFTSLEQAYNLYGSGYTMYEASINAGSLGIGSTGYVEGLNDVVFDFVTGSSMGSFYDIAFIGIGGSGNRESQVARALRWSNAMHVRP